MTHHRDAGVVAPVETMYLLVFAIVVTALIAFLGRLHAAGVEVSAVAQAAARAASMEPSSAAAVTAAERAVVDSPLATRCAGSPSTEVDWSPSPTGTWQGGSVRVRVVCTVSNASLAGGLLPGTRTISASDSQPIDRYQR
jgi:Flp pilus assembly protein TadG